MDTKPFILLNLVLIMSKKDNFTIFFVKPPHFDISEEIIIYLKQKLSTDFCIDYREHPKTTFDFWAEFYRKVETVNPVGFDYMVNNYPVISDGKIDLVFLSGNRIAERVKNISGPTMYEDNSSDTIRGRFGPYELPNSIIHAPKLEEVKRDLRILRKHVLID